MGVAVICASLSSSAASQPAWVHSQGAAASGSAEAQYSLQYELVPAWNSTSLWQEQVALSQRIDTMAETSIGSRCKARAPAAGGGRRGWHLACE